MFSALPSFLYHPEALLLFVAGAVAGGFVNGFAGFGTALFTLGFWLVIMPPLQAVSLIVITSMVTGLQGLWIVRAEMARQPRRVLRFILPGIIGIPAGIAGLQAVDVDTLKLIIGLFMLGYGLFFMARTSLPTLTNTYPVADALIGLVGGVLGGLAALSGALPTFWLSMHDWTKAEIRAVLQPFNLTILSLTALLLAIQGAYTNETLILVLICLPISVLSAQIGITVFKRLRDVHFRRTLIILMFISGVLVLGLVFASLTGPNPAFAT